MRTSFTTEQYTIIFSAVLASSQMFSALALRHRWSQQSQDLWIKDKNEQSGLRLEIKKTVQGGAFMLKRIRLWSCEYVDVTDTADSCCFEVETVAPRKWLKATETDIGSIWRTNESLPTAELTWEHWLTRRNPNKRVYWRLKLKWIILESVGSVSCSKFIKLLPTRTQE